LLVLDLNWLAEVLSCLAGNHLMVAQADAADAPASTVCCGLGIDSIGVSDAAQQHRRHAESTDSLAGMQLAD
jgi:hypothetical protein